MLYLYKILRITAWLLVIATVVSLFSGYLAIKFFLSPGANYTNIHVVIIPWIFIPLFYIHSAIGFLNLLSRHKATNKKWIKIICEIIWLAIFIFLLWVILAKPPASNVTPITNNNSLNSVSVVLSIAEIAKHNSKNDCWMIINSGKDGSASYATKNGEQSHSRTADNILSSYYLGKLNGTIKF
jgi:hypothetical protein